MSEPRLALLDTSCVIDPPTQLDTEIVDFAVSTVTIAELALGLHSPDPMTTAAREQRYRRVLEEFDPVPYSVGAAHWYGALAESARRAGRNPRSRTVDLLLASVALDLHAELITRNPGDFRGVDHIVKIVAV